VISGKLANNTIWWLSTNGEKIWIESKEIEQEKFQEKGYRVADDRIFSAVREIGELTVSRLESRKRKEAWIIKVDAMLNVYPELVEEIRRKDIEEKKKKKTGVSHKSKREIKKIYPVKIDSIIDEHKDDIVEEKDNTESEKIPDNKPVRDYFSVDRPYVTWIKDEIDKSKIGEMIISFKDLKGKMGEEFEEMDNFRIFFGLNKILPKIGLTLQTRIIKKENMAIIKKS